MFTSLRSLRLRVTWRTESSNNYIHKSSAGVSCLLLSCHVGFRLGIAFISSGIASNGVIANYLQNSPIKLLNVKTVATRFPASDSEFRINVVNGEVSTLFFSSLKKMGWRSKTFGPETI